MYNYIHCSKILLSKNEGKNVFHTFVKEIINNEI